jgi:hypothetical protein
VTLIRVPQYPSIFANRHDSDLRFSSKLAGSNPSSARNDCRMEARWMPPLKKDGKVFLPFVIGH